MGLGALSSGDGIITAVALAAGAVVLGWAAWTDHRTRRIPNAAVAALAGLWLLWRLALGAWACWMQASGQLDLILAPTARFLAGAWDSRPLGLASAPEGLLAAAVAGLGLLAFTAAYEALAKKEALGGGDIKLMAALALFLGPGRSAVCLLVACVVALASVAATRNRPARQGEKAAEAGPPGTFAFGPALAIGAVIALMPGTNFFLLG